MKNKFFLTSGVIATLALASCSTINSIAYKPTVTQGNPSITSPEKMGQLKSGMSTAEVKKILGTPMITGRAEHLDYVYTIENKNVVTIYHLPLTFKADKLVSPIPAQVMPKTESSS